MCPAGHPSWTVVEDEPRDLHLVLFVRDCFGLGTGHGGVGPLTAAVPDLGDRVTASGVAAAAAAWPAWWRAALGRFSDVASPAAVELRELVDAALPAFQEWWSPPPDAAGAPGARRPALPGVRGQLVDLHLNRLTVARVVNRLEEELGRQARPFEFRVDILAVGEPSVVASHPGSAVISAELVGFEPRYEQWLHGVLRALV